MCDNNYWPLWAYLVIGGCVIFIYVFVCAGLGYCPGFEWYRERKKKAVDAALRERVEKLEAIVKEHVANTNIYKKFVIVDAEVRELREQVGALKKFSKRLEDDVLLTTEVNVGLILRVEKLERECKILNQRFINMAEINATPKMIVTTQAVKDKIWNAAHAHKHPEYKKKKKARKKS